METTSESNDKTQRRSKQQQLLPSTLRERGIKILILYHILVTKIVTSTSNGIK